MKQPDHEWNVHTTPEEAADADSNKPKLLPNHPVREALTRNRLTFVSSGPGDKKLVASPEAPHPIPYPNFIEPFGMTPSGLVSSSRPLQPNGGQASTENGWMEISFRKTRADFE